MPRKRIPGQPRYRSTNSTPPITVRIGRLRPELDARSDGTQAGYRAVIQRDLARYYAMLSNDLAGYEPLPIESARSYYDVWVGGSTIDILPHLDAIERAHILVEHGGLSIDDALVAVGLVKKG